MGCFVQGGTGGGEVWVSGQEVLTVCPITLRDRQVSRAQCVRRSSDGSGSDGGLLGKWHQQDGHQGL